MGLGIHWGSSMDKGVAQVSSSVVFLSPGCALALTGDYIKMLKPSVHPNHSDLIGLGLGPGFGIS